MRVCATSRRLASVVFSPAGHGTSTPTSITIATTTVGTVPSDTSWNTAGGVHHGTSNPFQGRVDLGQQAPVPVGRSSGLLGPSPGRTRPARSTPPAPPAPVDPRRTVPQTSGPRQRSDHQHKPVHQQAGDSSAPDLVLRQLLVEQPCPIAARRHQVVGAGTLRRTVPPSPFDVQPAEHRKPIEVARSVHRGAARARSSLALVAVEHRLSAAHDEDLHPSEAGATAPPYQQSHQSLAHGAAIRGGTTAVGRGGSPAGGLGSALHPAIKLRVGAS